MTKLNTKFSIVNRVITLVCNFICRSVFIKFLGGEYLGAGGMFGNVFSVLSLFELGFGEAASQAMYKPLADGNALQVKKIVKYYTKVYRYISLITLTLSFAVMPYLDCFFPDITKISKYRSVYILFIIHQILSFRFAPKRALIMCDQRMYIIMLIRTISCVCITFTQIICLIYTRSYLGFIFLRILFLAADGFATEIYANKKYDLKALSNISELQEKTKSLIKANTLSLAVHRIGGVINNSTDSILLSSYLGLSQMGIYSNYSLIINSLGSFVCLAVNAASASVGNLGAAENAEKSVSILKKMCFANFFLLTNCASLLICLINPFILLWLGKDMCFSLPESAVIIACFYMSYIRDPVQIFLNTYGVFKSTKYLYLTRGLANLVISFCLVRRFGVVGVFGGTLISTVACVFFTEPYMLYKNGFGIKYTGFLKKYVGYVIASVFICTLSYIFTTNIPADSVLSLILKGCTVAVFTNILLLVLYGKTKELHELLITFKLIKKRNADNYDMHPQS